MSYYEMLENVHVIIKKEEEEQFNFWRGECYKLQEFKDCGLNLESLLEKELCKRTDETSKGLNKQERYDYMAYVLKIQSYAIHYMSEEYLRDYIEMIHLFLNNDDNISQRADISNMAYVVKNTLKGYEG